LILALCSPAYAASDEAKVAFDRHDYATALKIWQTRAKHGDAAAQNDLGYMYAHSEGMTLDYGQVLAWYRKTTDKSFTQTETNFGSISGFGQVVPQDYGQALAWYRKAADKGYALNRAGSAGG